AGRQGCRIRPRGTGAGWCCRHRYQERLLGRARRILCSSVEISARRRSRGRRLAQETVRQKRACLILTFEVVLPLGAIAFYLYDSAMLLYGNELVFLKRGGRWRATGGLEGYIGSRRLCLPALFRPWVLLFRVLWKESD